MIYHQDHLTFKTKYKVELKQNGWWFSWHLRMEAKRMASLQLWALLHLRFFCSDFASQALQMRIIASQEHLEQNSERRYRDCWWNALGSNSNIRQMFQLHIIWILNPCNRPNDYNHDDEMIIKTQSELDGAKRLWKKDK